jgi:hypothetical protein
MILILHGFSIYVTMQAGKYKLQNLTQAHFRTQGLDILSCIFILKQHMIFPLTTEILTLPLSLTLRRYQKRNPIKILSVTALEIYVYIDGYRKLDKSK